MRDKPRKPRPPKLNPSVFRPGDLFLVKEPVLVKRVGYPLGHEDAVKHVRATLETEITALFSKLGAQIDTEFAAKNPEQMADKWAIKPSYATHDLSHWDVKRVVAGLASHWLKLKHFGGSARSLHTYREESLKLDVECQVLSRKTVKTGTRYSPSGSQDYWTGEWEYEPGGLADEQTHVLLEFRPVCALDELMVTSLEEDKINRLWIEARHCIKTYDSATNQRIDPITQKPLDKNQSF